MKMFLCLLLVCGINYISCFSSTLSKDLNDVGAIIPTQDIFNIFDAIKFNAASHDASNYVSSNAFHNSIYLIFKHPDMKPLKQYFELNAVDIEELFLKIVALKEKVIPNHSQSSGKRSLQVFIEHAYSVSQMDNIISLVIHKTATSPAFQTLYSLLNELDHEKIYSDLMAIPKVQTMVDELNKVGINTAEIWKALSYLFGWETTKTIVTIAEYEVEEDKQTDKESELFLILRQYINLIPKEKFIFLYRGLLVNPLFQEIITYIFNKQYYDILDKFNENPIIGEFFDYLKDRGVSFIKFLDLLRDRLGFTYAYYRIPTGGYEENSHSYSLVQFFDMAKKILPLNKIKKLSISMLDTNEEYKKLAEKVNNLISNHNLELYFENQLEIRNKAVQYGFCMNKILNFIFVIIGFDYNIPVKGRAFTEGIYEFLDLFPKYDYVKLYNENKNFTNIWKLVTFLKGPNFADFVEALFTTNEFKIFSNFLTKYYIPFKAVLIDLFDRLGIMQWWINYEFFCGKSSDKCKGAVDPNADNLRQFIQDRINLFPTRKILLLFHNKLETNSYFQNLYLMLSKIDAANLLKKITEHDVLRLFFVKLVEIGYDFRGTVAQLSKLFKWGNLLTLELSLNQTIENFDNLLYRKELFKILKKYPDEVQQLKEFYKNPSFTNTVGIFSNIPVARNIIEWMENLDVPVLDYVNYYFGQNTPNVFHLKLDSQLHWGDMAHDIANFFRKVKLFEFSVAQKYASIEFHALLNKLLFVDFSILSVFHELPDSYYVSERMFSTGVNFLNVYKFLEDVSNDASVNVLST